MAHVGSVPPLPGALCGCACQRCVFSRAHGCDSRAGAVCINSRTANAHPLMICHQRHRGAVPAGAPEWSRRDPSAAGSHAAAAGQANMLSPVHVGMVSPEEQPWVSRRVYPFLCSASCHPGFLRGPARTDGARCNTLGKRRESRDLSLPSTTSVSRSPGTEGSCSDVFMYLVHPAGRAALTCLLLRQTGLVCDSFSLALLVLLVLLKVRSLLWAEGVPRLNHPEQIKWFERNRLFIAVSTHSSRRTAGSPSNIHGSCEREVMPALH